MGAERLILSVLGFVYHPTLDCLIVAPNGSVGPVRIESAVHPTTDLPAATSALSSFSSALGWSTDYAGSRLDSPQLTLNGHSAALRTGKLAGAIRSRNMIESSLRMPY